ncbi:restriction endonuclease subunit S [Streptosporangium sp. H16]|uniref:restriction endonuclease subunit S n=1 Tax=Streptosporangium sp. H16 TaxID=3444184 RepID=UPI003F793671
MHDASPWPMRKLGDLFSVSAGITLGPHRQPSKSASGYLRVANVQRGKIDISDLAFMEASLLERQKYQLMAGDLLVVEGHANPEEIGRCARVDREAEGLLHQNHLFRLRSIRVRSEFGEAWLNSQSARAYWRMMCATSSGLYTINSRQLAAMPFPEMPLWEQRRIVDIISALDLKMSALDRQIDKDDLIRDSLVDRLISACSGPSMLLVDLASKESGSTVIGPFGSDLTAGDYRSNGVPVVFVRDINVDGFRWVSNVYVDSAKARTLSAHQVRAQDVVLTKMGLPPCVAAVYPDGMANGIITADIIRLRPDMRIVNPRWLTLAINHEIVRSQIRTITGGITRPKVTLADVRNIRVDLPSLNEQNGIVEVIAACDDRLVGSINMRRKLSKLKQGLVDDLLAGRVRVKDVENML